MSGCAYKSDAYKFCKSSGEQKITNEDIIRSIEISFDYEMMGLRNNSTYEEAEIWLKEHKELWKKLNSRQGENNV